MQLGLSGVGREFDHLKYISFAFGIEISSEQHANLCAVSSFVLSGIWTRYD
jgi:hypothetical protein